MGGRGGSFSNQNFSTLTELRIEVINFKMKLSTDYAEAIPFSRSNLALAIGETRSKVGNWIDRNLLWQRSHTHGYYRLSEVFDLAGFAALRIAHIPEKDCASYVYNYGFYRSFLHGDQLNHFSYRESSWDIGIYDPSALVSLTINMRTLGADIFKRISEEAAKSPECWPDNAFESFRFLYLKAVEMNRLDYGAVPIFEEGAS